MLGVPISIHIQLTQLAAQILIIHILTAIKADYIKTIGINKIIGLVLTSPSMNKIELQLEQLGIASVTTIIPMTYPRSKDFTTLMMFNISMSEKNTQPKLSLAYFFSIIS
jgi:hypothetical protein